MVWQSFNSRTIQLHICFAQRLPLHAICYYHRQQPEVIWHPFIISGAWSCMSDQRSIPMQLASGGCFGMDQPIAFQLLGSKEESLDLLEGTAMELEDSLYPLLREAQPTSQLILHR